MPKLPTVVADQLGDILPSEDEYDDPDEELDPDPDFTLPPEVTDGEPVKTDEIPAEGQ